MSRAISSTRASTAAAAFVSTAARAAIGSPDQPGKARGGGGDGRLDVLGP